MKQRILTILIALDQFIYTIITLGSGAPDETMSAAAWRLETAGRLAGRIFRPVIDHVLWFDPAHCQTSFEFGIARAKFLQSLGK